MEKKSKREIKLEELVMAHAGLIGKLLMILEENKIKIDKETYVEMMLCFIGLTEVGLADPSKVFGKYLKKDKEEKEEADIVHE